MNGILVTALVLCLSSLMTSFAQAHAFLDESEPKVGSRIKVSPAAVQIWFTKDIVKTAKGATSNIAVYNAKGEEVDEKDVQIDPKDRSLLTVSVPPLAAGVYKVVWDAVCRDSHHTTGSFTFEVATSG
jgi:methionine-rich copper-binding protein CopC